MPEVIRSTEKKKVIKPNHITNAAFVMSTLREVQLDQAKRKRNIKYIPRHPKVKTSAIQVGDFDIHVEYSTVLLERIAEKHNKLFSS